MAGLFSYIKRNAQANPPVKASHFDPERDLADLTGKTYLITGGAGIGGETARVLASKGATVYVAGRNREKTQAAITQIKQSTGKDDIHFVQVDLADLRSVKSGAEDFLKRVDRLDALILNAGVMACPPSLKTAQGYDMQFGTNVVGHHYLAVLLLDLLLKTAKSSPPNTVRVVWLTSSGHALAPGVGIDFKDVNLPKANRWTKYGQSKLGDMILAKEMDRRYRKDGIISVSVHPGVISTELTRYIPLGSKVAPYLFSSVKQGALSSLWTATSPEVTTEDGGKYAVPYARWHEPAHPVANDAEVASKLWAFCEDAERKAA